LLVARATSAGIAGERIAEGSFGVALAANAVATIAAIATLLLTVGPLLAFFEDMPTADVEPRSYLLRRAAILIPQALGAVAGIAFVHLALHREVAQAMPWLSERPAQFVNDAVAVCGLLALVWATANRLDSRLFVAALFVMTAYRATAPAWHLDQSPHGFQTTIQQLVLAQFAAAAFGLLVFQATRARTTR
jgi:hypothetical protein